MYSRIQLDAPDSIAKLRKLPISSLREYFLPEIDSTSVRFAFLSVRTQNGLRRLLQQGSINSLQDLPNHTVGELLDLPFFGMKSLFDLLSAVQPFVQPMVVESRSVQSNLADKTLSLKEVDDILARALCRLPQIENLHFPGIAGSARLSNLPLKRRTRNCIEQLIRSDVIIEVTDLSQIPISRLFKTKNFGQLTFIDLLSGLRPYMLDVDEPRESATVELLRVLDKLRNSALCSRVRCDDPRFKDDLVVLLTIANCNRTSTTLPTETVTALAANLMSMVFSNSETKRALVSIKGLREGIRRTLHVRLEREFRELLRASLDERTCDVVSRVYGLDGRGGATLQEVGDEYHLTRERIRQISDRLKPLAKCRPFLPQLDRSLRLITSKLPNRADAIEQALVDKRISLTAFRLEGIRLAAELFNRRIRFEVAEINGARIAVKIRQPEAASGILKMAQASVSRLGVCAVSSLVENLHEERESVIGILTTQSNVKWLDTEQEWFLITDSKRNRLLTLVMKVAAVAPTIEAGELRRALSRNYRLEFVPPRSVLIEFCRQLGWHVKESRVTAPKNLRADDVLSVTEMMMTRVLKERGPVLYRTEFQELCAARGISRSTFSMYVGNNSIFSRVTNGVYSLTGATFDSFDVESCLKRNRASISSIADCGWTAEAKPWVALKMTPTIVANGVFAIPSSIRSFLFGRFVIQASDGTDVGKIQVSEQRAWGLSPLIRRWKVEPGDTLVLEFDLKGRRVKVHLGGDDLVELFCDVNADGTPVMLEPNQGEII